MKLKLFFVALIVMILSACTASINIEINFDSNGGSDVASIDFSITEGSLEMPKNPTKEGFVFAGWYFDNGVFEVPFTLNSLLNNPISDSITVYAKWSEDDEVVIGMLQVVFVSDGEEVDTRYSQSGLPLSFPNIKKTGHTLEGWYISYNDGSTLDEKWDFTSDIISKDIILYAKWNINQYTLTLKGVEDFDITFSLDYNHLLNLNDPIKEGHTFIGWQYSEVTIPTNMPAENIELTALWQINSYTVNYYDSSQRLYVNDLLLDQGDSIKDLSTWGWGSDILILTEKGHLYLNFVRVQEDFELLEGEFKEKVFLGPQVYAFSTNLGNLYVWKNATSGSVFYANISQDVPSIFFTSLSGIRDVQFGSVKGGIVTNDSNLYLWGENNYNGDLWDISSRSKPALKTGNVKEINFSISHLLTVIKNDNSIHVGGRQESYTRSVTNSNNSGYYGQQIRVNASDSNVLSAVSNKQFIYIYDKYIYFSGTNAYNSYSGYNSRITLGIEESDFFTKLYSSERNTILISSEGRVFIMGDGTDSKLGDAASAHSRMFMEITALIERNLREGEKVVDAYISQFVIYYRTNQNRLLRTNSGAFTSVITNIEEDFELVNTASIVYNQNSTYVPEKEGYIFDGWYFDNQYQNPLSGTITENTDLYAKWIAKSVTVTFETYHGSDIEAITDVAGNFVNTYNSSSDGYIFDGYYMDEEYTEVFDGVLRSSDFTVYAKWTPIDYTATYIIYEDDISNAGLILEPGETIIKQETGVASTYILTSENRFLTVGYNNYGELGIGNTSSRSVFQDITSNFNLSENETIVDFDAMFHHVILLTSENRVFTWGLNNYYQLGTGNNSNQTLPYELTVSRLIFEEDEVVLKVEVGGYHSGILTNKNLYMFGGNWQNQLGTGNATQYGDFRIPSIPLADDETIIDLQLSGYTSMVLTSNNRVFTWGYGYYGALGDGSTSNNSTPIDITSRFDANLTEGDYIKEIYNDSYQVGFAISNNGVIFSWGYGNRKQRGDLKSYSNESNPVNITENFNFLDGERVIKFANYSELSVVLTNYGRIFIFGYSSHINVALGFNSNLIHDPILINDYLDLEDYESIKDFSVGSGFMYVYTSERRLLSFGTNSEGGLGKPNPSLTSINSIAARKITSQTVNVEGEYIFDDEKESFTLDGFYSNFEMDETFDSVLAQDVYLYVKYIPDNISITFVFENGDSDQVITQVFGSIYNKPEDPVREGYTFVGWDQTLPHFLPSENVTYTAIWSINTYQIILLDWDGTEIETYDIEYSSDLSSMELPSPTRVGYDFIGWDEDLVSRMPAENITLNATYSYFERTEFNENTDINDLFGETVLVNDDYYIVSAPKYNNNQGAIFVYKFSSRNYEREILGAGTTTQSYFGSSVITVGNYIIVGAFGDPSFSEIEGKVFIYKLDDPSYERILSHEDFIAGDLFGLNIVVDGDFLVISAHNYDEGRGRVYVYKLSDDSYVRVINDPADQENAFFGYDVAVLNNYLAVSSIGYDNDSGKVYIYKLDDTDYLREEVNPTENENTGFGNQVLFNGSYLIVSSEKDTNNKGKVYIYSMTDTDYLRTLNPDGTSSGGQNDGSIFGSSIATYGDYLAITAKNDSTVYVFKFSDETYIREITSSDDDFGRVLDLHENFLAISSENYDNKKGAVYLYYLDDADYERLITGSDSLSLDLFGSAIVLTDNHIYVGVKNYDSKTGIVYIYKTT